MQERNNLFRNIEDIANFMYFLTIGPLRSRSFRRQGQMNKYHIKSPVQMCVLKNEVNSFPNKEVMGNVKDFGQNGLWTDRQTVQKLYAHLWGDIKK